jgi:hypothetical protein
VTETVRSELHFKSPVLSDRHETRTTNSNVQPLISVPNLIAISSEIRRVLHAGAQSITQNLSLRVQTMLFVRQTNRYIHVQHSTNSRCGRQHFMSLYSWGNPLLPLWTRGITVEMELVLSQRVHSLFCFFFWTRRNMKCSCWPEARYSTVALALSKYTTLLFCDRSATCQHPLSSKNPNSGPLQPCYAVRELKTHLYKQYCVSLYTGVYISTYTETPLTGLVTTLNHLNVHSLFTLKNALLHVTCLSILRNFAFSSTLYK